MTIAKSVTLSAGPFTGNGATTAFPLDFPVQDATDVRVWSKATDGTVTELTSSQFVVDATNSQVVIYPAPATGVQVAMWASYDEDQLTDFTSMGRFFPQVHEDEFDSLTLLVKQLRRDLDHFVTSYGDPFEGASLDVAKIVVAGTDYMELLENLYNQTKAASDAAHDSADTAVAAATAASGSAVAAADSEANAENAWTTFHGSYFGALPEDPTEDPYGGPLQEGDAYYNTGAHRGLRVFNAYLGVWEGPQTFDGYTDHKEYVATQGQTTFSVKYDTGDGRAFVSVYVNGLKLPSGDYTATDGETVTLSTALPAGTEVVLDGVGVFTPAVFRDAVEEAQQYAQEARDAAASSGPYQVFATRAEANAALPGLTEGQWVRVQSDETAIPANTTWVYQVVNGSFANGQQQNTADLITATTSTGQDQRLDEALDQRAIQVDNVLAMCQNTRLRVHKLQVQLRAFYADNDAGGGNLWWDANRPKSEANGGTIIDPDALNGYDGTPATLDKYYDDVAGQGSGTGTGCFVADSLIKTPYCFGFDNTGLTQNALQQCTTTLQVNGPLTNGSVLLNSSENISLDKTLDIYRSSLILDGRRSIVEFSFPSAGTSGIKIVDSTKVKIKDLYIVSDKSSFAPNSAIEFYRNGTSDNTGTNEYCELTGVAVGATYEAEAYGANRKYGDFDHGVLFSGVTGNNDSFRFEKCEFRRCNVAAISLLKDQSIWGSLRDITTNFCGLALELGCNTLVENLCCNRSIYGDIKLIRDCNVTISGYNSEHCPLPVESWGGSVWITGGEVLKSNDSDGFFAKSTGGTFSLDSVNWHNSGIGRNIILKYSPRGVNATDGPTTDYICVKNSRIIGGELRDNWQITTDVYLKTIPLIDIEVGGFKWKTSDRYSEQDVSGISIQSGETASLQTSQSINSQYNGSFYIPAIRDMPDNCHLSNYIYSEFLGGVNVFNVGTQQETVPATKLRLACVNSKITNKTTHTHSSNISIPAKSSTHILVSAPWAKKGDVIVVSSGSPDFYLLKSAYVSTDGTVCITLFNKQSSNVTLGTPKFFFGKLSAEYKKISHNINSFSLQPQESIVLEVANTFSYQGAHAVGAIYDLPEGILVSYSCSKTNVISIVLTNGTSSSITFSDTIASVGTLF